MNLFTTSDARILAGIRAKLHSYRCYRTVIVLADRDADLHIGPDAIEEIDRRLAAHPDQFVGNYGKKSDPLEIMEDLLARKCELLKYGREQRALHPHLKLGASL